MRRRFRRRKASWIWADSDTLSAVDNLSVNTPTYASSPNLLPCKRVDWLLDNQGRDRMVVKRILLWVCASVQIPSGAAGSIVVPDMQLYVIKTSADPSQAATTVQYQPFSNPAAPSGVTNWVGTGGTDGTDPFLWCHYMFVPEENTPGGLSTTLGVGTVTSSNTAAGIGRGASVTGYWSSPTSVSPALSPNVDIRVSRRLMKNDELQLGFMFFSGNTGTTYQVRYATRVLAS